MITSLALRNFKAWEATGPIEFGPITAFFGSNSSGKTSILQSLLLLKQTTDSADRGRVFDLGGSPSSLVNLGAFQDLIYAHDMARALGIDVAWELGYSLGISDPETGEPMVHDGSARLSVNVAEARSFPVVMNVEYGAGDSSFALVRRGADNDYELESGGYQFKRVVGRPARLPAPGKFYSFPDQVRASYQNAAFLSDLELMFEEFCRQIRYLGPMRQDPQRQYVWSGGRPTDVGRRGELTVDALIASQVEGPTNSRGFGKDGRRLKRISKEEHVAAWLKQLGLIHSFMVESVDDRKTLYRVSVRRGRHSPPVLLTDVGFGVSQVLPVVAQLAYVPEGSIVLLEQPEIHLHPSVQSGLADVIIEAAKTRSLQVVVESHSEHLLMRLQRRIAERQLERGIELTPDDCRLYFCDTDAGKATISRLDLDPFGNITNWPTDFFGDSFGEAAAMTRAGRRRREQA